jgi:sodium/proline symporter
MMGVGIASAMTWSLLFKWSSVVYEVLRGMAAGILVYLVAQLFTPNSLSLFRRQK